MGGLGSEGGGGGGCREQRYTKEEEQQGEGTYNLAVPQPTIVRREPPAINIL